MKDMRAHIKTLEERIRDMKPGTGNGIDQEELDNLKELIDNLRKEFE